jgi:hypothetical protein
MRRPSPLPAVLSGGSPVHIPRSTTAIFRNRGTQRYQTTDVDVADDTPLR